MSSPPAEPRQATSFAKKSAWYRNFSLGAWVGSVTAGTVFVVGLALWVLHNRGVAGGLGEHLKIATGLTAVVGAAIAVVISYRRQQTTEKELQATVRRDEMVSIKDQRDLEMAVIKEYRERFADAVTQLGTQIPTVALAGVYSLANLADDWGSGRQQCIDIFCARLRLPWPYRDGAPRGVDIDDEPLLWDEGEQEIRTTILRVMRDHLIRRFEDHATVKTTPGVWPHLDYDFSHAHLPQLDFSDCEFSGSVRFNDATFSRETSFAHATFERDSAFTAASFTRTVQFDRAIFMGRAWFARTKFTQDGWFNGTHFAREAWFTGATFHGDAFFTEARFDGDTFVADVEFTHEPAFANAVFCSRLKGQGVTQNGGPLNLEEVVKDQTEKYPSS